MKSKPLILWVTGDNEIKNSELKRRLAHSEFEIIILNIPLNIVSDFQHYSPELIVVGPDFDVGSNLLDLAKNIRQYNKLIPIILVSRQSSETLLIAALRTGINDYLKWPLTIDELLTSIRNNFPTNTSAISPIKSHHNPDYGESESQILIGQSSLMVKLRNYLLKVAATDSNVLVTGETGTGKELVAQLIHQNSPRFEKPLISINCAALPDSLLESELYGYEKGAFTGACSSKEGHLQLADGGTIFFDEIGDMTPYAQAKILRAIETKEIYRVGGKKPIKLNFRIIAATNQNLESLVLEQKFRKDLFFRLNVARINLPPLRQRKEDISLLLNHYLQELTHYFNCHTMHFSEEALGSLLQYEWPGNVRELKNFVEALLINHSSNWIYPTDLPDTIRKSSMDVHTSERDLILTALATTQWNKSKAADKLNWSRMTLYRKMVKYQLHRSNTCASSIKDEDITFSI